MPTPGSATRSIAKEVVQNNAIEGENLACALGSEVEDCSDSFCAVAQGHLQPHTTLNLRIKRARPEKTWNAHGLTTQNFATLHSSEASSHALLQLLSCWVEYHCEYEVYGTEYNTHNFPLAIEKRSIKEAATQKATITIPERYVANMQRLKVEPQLGRKVTVWYTEQECSDLKRPGVPLNKSFKPLIMREN
ncbi:hypothetical protein K443DRAFT_123370 [Laccaria amethystina LaAM-08-1]|uniref:Uncharacterized protein n=1 Tax=Laccaria amethystina LaAM-08-1 TaxID=1095629 RepID=A0A0C9XC49_9AGAR|nr:hypothetical protein K443DRAFT_123370 [Laccaria amethystina LaAM-08-1]